MLQDLTRQMEEIPIWQVLIFLNNSNKKLKISKAFKKLKLWYSLVIKTLQEINF